MLRVTVEAKLRGLLGLSKSDLSGDEYRVQLGGWFYFSICHKKKDVSLDDGPLSLKKWMGKFFLIDHRAIPNYLTWRHSCSCVLDDLLTDGYDQNDVERLCARLICFREIREEVRVRSASDTTPEPSQSSKKRKLSKRASEAGSSAPELGQDKDVDEANIANFYTEIKNSLERDEGTSTKATSAPTPRLGKRLGAPPFVAIVSASGPSHVGTSTRAFTSGRNFSLRGAAISGHDKKSGAEVMQRQMDLLDSLARSALAHDVECFIHMKVLLPPYTKEEWNGHHELEDNIFCKDIFKDLDVCRKSLDQTITPVELKRTESLLQLDLSNHFNVLSALLVSYVAELNYRYTGEQGSAFLKDDASVKALIVRDFQNQLALEKAKYQGYKEAVDGLREEVTRFVGSVVESLGLRMGPTDTEFEVVAQKVSNFFIGAKADFKKALVDFPTTPFPFLVKIVAASVGTLSEVTQILSDKHIHLVTCAPIALSIANEDANQVPFEHASDDLAASI
nr:hypothetical protein [Tanacetum cinerariifolium]